MEPAYQGACDLIVTVLTVTMGLVIVFGGTVRGWKALVSSFRSLSEDEMNGDE